MHKTKKSYVLDPRVEDELDYMSPKLQQIGQTFINQIEQSAKSFVPVPEDDPVAYLEYLIDALEVGPNLGSISSDNLIEMLYNDPVLGAIPLSQLRAEELLRGDNIDVYDYLQAALQFQVERYAEAWLNDEVEMQKAVNKGRKEKEKIQKDKEENLGVDPNGTFIDKPVKKQKARALLPLLSKHAIIKKCRPQDKKDGRKHPVEDQNFCLWDKEEEKILYAAPTKSDAEGQERAVHYYSNASINSGAPVIAIVGDQVFRRATIQAVEPPTEFPDFKLFFRTAAEEGATSSRRDVELWLSKVVVYARKLETTEKDLLSRLVKRVKVFKNLPGNYARFTGERDINLNKLFDLSDAYGSAGIELVERSNALQEVFAAREKWVDTLLDFYDNKIEYYKLNSDDPIRIYWQEAASALRVDEAIVGP